MPQSFAKGIKDFVNNVPDEKLKGLPLDGKEVYKTRDYSLVMQSVLYPL